MDVETKTTAGQVMGIIGIVLAVISLILAFIPCVGVVAFLPAGIAIIFSIISIVQATNGYGSKGLGIGALVVSIISTLIAALWFAVFSGSLMLDNAFNGNADLEIFGKEFSKKFKNDFSSDFEKGFKEGFEDGNVKIRIESDSLEKTLRQLESGANNFEITIDEEKNKGKNKVKKTTVITIKPDSIKVTTDE